MDSTVGKSGTEMPADPCRDPPPAPPRYRAKPPEYQNPELSQEKSSFEAERVSAGCRSARAEVSPLESPPPQAAEVEE